MTRIDYNLMKAPPPADVWFTTKTMRERADAHEYQEQRLTASMLRFAAAEIERLQNELRLIYRGYLTTCEAARDRILAVGGECDGMDTMERDDPHLIRIRAALSDPQGTQG